MSCQRIFGAVLASLLFVAANAAPSQGAGDAVGQWSFDEALGSPTAIDTTANGNDGTLVGPIRIVSPFFGNALSFDGDDYVQIANAPTILKPTVEYAISVWFRYSGTTRNELVSMGDHYAVYVDNTKVHTFFRNPPGWTNVGSPDVNANDGVWHHLVGQKTLDGLELWFDGLLVSTLATTDVITYDLPTGTDLFFGSWGQAPAALFTGDMDEVWIFDRALSPSEIEMLKVSNTVGPTFSCIGFEPPVADATTPVLVKKPNRALPFKAEIVDGDGVPVTDVDLSEPPVIQILYESGIASDSEDVSGDALPVGVGTEGNQFEFAGNKWQYNLKLKNFTGVGTYAVTMERADAFFIQPTCAGRFVVEP